MIPDTEIDSAAAPNSAKPQKPRDLTSFNLVPSPQAPETRDESAQAASK
jgi:hypothetical protein